MKIFFKLIALFLFLTGTGLSAYAKHPEQNPMVFGKNRLSIITPTLLRLEYAVDGKFIDAPLYLRMIGHRCSRLKVSMSRN